MYRNANRGGPSCGHTAHKIMWRLVQQFQRYARRQTDRHIDRRVDHDTLHSNWGRVIRNEDKLNRQTYIAMQWKTVIAWFYIYTMAENRLDQSAACSIKIKVNRIRIIRRRIETFLWWTDDIKKCCTFEDGKAQRMTQDGTTHNWHRRMLTV